LERYTARHIVSDERPFVVAQSTLECQMSKRKPATASKHARSPKIAARSHRANQDVVRSPKDKRPRLVAAGPSLSPPERHNDSRQEAPFVENPVTALQVTLQDDCNQTMPDDGSKRGFGFSSATADLQAYQTKMMEMAQANMQFGFEFAQRLATLRSPVEFLSVIGELTSKRIAMFRKHSKEMAELSTWRLAA
jgi:hypothetical protein